MIERREKEEKKVIIVIVLCLKSKWMMRCRYVDVNREHKRAGSCRDHLFQSTNRPAVSADMPISEAMVAAARLLPLLEVLACALALCLLALEAVLLEVLDEEELPLLVLLPLLDD